MEDEDLLRKLRCHAKEKLITIARSLGKPFVTIKHRVQKLEGVLIKRYTALLDFARMGYGSTAHIVLSVDIADKERLHAFLQKDPSLNTMFRINNGYDFLLEVVHHRFEDTEQFIEHLQKEFKIKKFQVHYTLQELYRERFLASR